MQAPDRANRGETVLLGWRFESKILGAFAAAAMVAAALTALTWGLARSTAEAEQAWTQTQQVLNDLARTRGRTLEIELATQTFRLAGDPTQLAVRDEAVAAREASLARIHELIHDDAQQAQRWEALRALVNQRLAISHEVETLYNTQGPKAAAAYAASAPLKATRARTYQLLEDMDEAARRMLTEREARQSALRENFTLAGTLLSLFLACFLLASHAVIRQQLRQNRRTQQALSDSEEDLSTTLQSIGDAVLATDTEGRITRMNPVAEKLTGWPLADALGRQVDEVFHIINERTRARALMPVTQVLQTGRMQALANHTALIARDGSECPIADSAAPILDNRAQLRGVVLVFRDVRAEHEAEQIIREQNAMLQRHVLEQTAQLRESDAFLQHVLSSVPALVAYVNAEQRYVYVNDQYRRYFAPQRSDIRGCTVQEVLGGERYAVAGPLIAKALLGEPQGYDWQPFAGQWQTVRYFPRRDEESGPVVGYYVLGLDITERKQTEDHIQSLNSELNQRVHDLEHVSRALRTLSAGNRTMLRAHDEATLLADMCDAVVHVGGYSMAVVWYGRDGSIDTLQAVAQCGCDDGLEGLNARPAPWTQGLPGQGSVAEAMRQGQTTLLKEPQSGALLGLACPLTVNEHILGALVIYGTENNRLDDSEIELLTEFSADLAFGIGNLHNRAERQKTREAMDRLSLFDPLTALPNENLFTQTLNAALPPLQPQPRPFAMLQTNIERLSEINDALGFSRGDQMLLEFGQRLRDVAPPNATVARLRGDEFAVLLPDGDADSAEELVQALQARLRHPVPMGDILIDLSAKVGIVLHPHHGSNPHELLRQMDKALHEAKKHGLGHCFYTPSMDHDPSGRLAMAGELRRGIENGELRLYLQPKVDMRSGRVCSAEGLVRWQHARLGLVPPGEFISLAEQTGLIKPLTEWVIEEALKTLHGWAQQGRALPIAINLSARNLRDADLPDKIRALQSAWSVATGLLELEITESTVMEDADAALRALHELRELGIPLHIDDFGTGYSSLSYLQQLPVDTIKIDQSFVRDLNRHKDSATIVRSTIDLVHDLGRKAIAEGVESAADWDLLAQWGCDMAQGYLIARPMPAGHFLGWLSDFSPPAQQPGAAD